MRSVIHKAFGQIRDNGKGAAFQVPQARVPDGEQMRDFVYVKDCVEVIWWF